MTTYTGTNAKIEVGPGVLRSDQLAQELIKAQAEERMAHADYRAAIDRLNETKTYTTVLMVEIATRSFAQAGVVFGKSVIRRKDDPDVEYLAVGVRSEGTLMVRYRTKTGKWFKTAQPLWCVTADKIDIVRNEE